MAVRQPKGPPGGDEGGFLGRRGGGEEGIGQTVESFEV